MKLESACSGFALRNVFTILSFLFTLNIYAADVVINFDDVTTNPVGYFPDPPGTYAGFVWEHANWSTDGDNGGARIVTNTQLDSWCSAAGGGNPPNAPSGTYQVYVSEATTKISIYRSSGTFNFVQARFNPYCTLGADILTFTGHVSGGSTITRTFNLSSAGTWPTVSFPELANLASLDISGGTGTTRLWMMDDFTYNLDPEIDILGNSQSIPDGSTPPSTANHTDFGTADVAGGSVVRTFTVRNLGCSNLNLSGSPRVAVEGTHAADFTVSTQPSTPVAPGGTATFQVTFDPSAAGLRTAHLRIANNDPNEGDYDFDIQGTGSAAPEIRVMQNSTNIADGSTVDFGSHNLSTNTDISFVIHNDGTGNLDLSGSPIITITGTHSNQFSVQLQPGTPVAPGGQTTFTLRFTPTSAGAKNAAIAIGNNDSDENPFDLNLTGTGLAPEMNIQQGATNYADGGTFSFGSQTVGYNTDVQFTLQNLGTTDLVLSGTPPYITFSGTHQADFSVLSAPDQTIPAGNSTTFTIRFTPGAVGARNAAFAIGNNDSDENPYDVNLTGTGVAPYVEINLKRGGTNIADGGSFDFGIHTLNTDWDVVFTIENTGNATLNLSGSPIITITGADAGQFSVQAQPSGTVAPTSSTTFTVRFRPTSEGAKTASIAIANDDTDENPYDLTLNGTGTKDMFIYFDDFTTQGTAALAGTYSGFNWSGEGGVVSDAQLSAWGCGRNSPSGDYQVRLASDPDSIHVAPVAGTFNFVGAHFAQYCFAGPATSVTLTGHTNEGGTVTCTVSPLSTNYQYFTCPNLTGLISMELVGNGNWLMDNFRYNQDTEIDVLGNNQSIADGDITPSTADLTDFGTTDVVAGSVTHTFVIKNRGAVALNLTGTPDRVQFTGPPPADFTIVQQPQASVAAGDSSNFQVTFDPTSTGLKTATLMIANTDADENPFDFVIQGTGSVAPEIEILGNGNTIADGDDSPSSTDNTDFGSTATPGGSVAHTFTVRNTGSGVLNLTGVPDRVVIGGVHAGDFSVTLVPAATAAALGGTTTFEVTFSPAAAGMRFAVISIANDDPDENPYDFYIRGTGAELDFGDAPDPRIATAGQYPTLFANNGARHLIVPGLMLGQVIDGELDGQPNYQALGDDNNTVPDDEDGVVFLGTLAPGKNMRTQVTVTSPAPAYLNAWIDFNADGSWNDAGEQVLTNIVVNNNIYYYNIAVPQTVYTNTCARFRLSSQQGLTPEGPANDGEVEDYYLILDSDGDGMLDSWDEGKQDRDNDSVPDSLDYDPTGYFYDESNGQIIPGGSVSISGPSGAVITLFETGAGGYYRFTTDGTAGTYLITVTLPPGCQWSSTCLVQPTALDPTGNPSPLMLGSGENGSTGYLVSNVCTPFYLEFDLEPGDPFVINNNFPLFRQPIAIDLASFTALCEKGIVRLQWRTDSEVNTAGYNLYRSTNPVNNYEKINETLIASKGTAAAGAEYGFTDQPEGDNTYYYKLEDIDLQGRRTLHGPVSVTVKTVPQSYQLYQNFPNPFNMETSVKYDVQETGFMTLQIFDVHGHLVRELWRGDRQAGSYSIKWDGRNNAGVPLPSGLYMVRFKAGTYVDMKKMILMK